MPCKLATGHPPATDRDDATAAEAAIHTTGETSRSHPQTTPTDDQSRLACTPSEADLRDNERESERLFRTTFDRAVVGIAHTSPEGRWLRVNQRLCDLLGYDCAELTAHTFQDVTYPDDLPATLVVRQSLLAGEVDAHEWDKRYVRKDGTLVWAHLTVTLVRTPAGAPDYFITMVQDITERMRLEQERAHLLERERAARVEAEMARVETEAAHVQLQALQALTDTALSHLALDDLLRELLDRVTAVMGVDHVAILLLEADGHTLTMRAARGLLEVEVGRVRIPVGQGFAGHIAASRAPLIVDETSTFDFYGAHPLMPERLHSVVGVPLLVQEAEEGQAISRLVGVIHVGSATLRRFSESDVQLLQRVADRVALAIDRARVYAAEQDARQCAETALAQAQVSEAEASARAEQLHTILETMADGVAVYDTAGRPIQMVNRAYRELFDLERGPVDYEGLTTFERARLVQLRDAATGALLPFEETPIGRALRGEVVMGPDADIRVRAFDGRELEVNSNAAPLRDSDGRLTGVILVLRDMTERNRLAREREAALARAQASEAEATARADQLRTILDTMADGVAVYDTAGRPIQPVNRAYRELYSLDHAPAGFDAMTTFERVRLVGVRDAVTGAPRPFEHTPVARALRGEVVTGSDADIRVRAFDGRELEVNNTAAPLRDREGRIVGAVLLLRDMTERNRLAREREAARADELAMREVNRRMEAFLAVAAHDLRSPLTAIVGFLDLAALQTERLADAVRETHSELVPRMEAVLARLEEASQGAGRLTRLLARLFDLAAIRADRLELRKAPCDLAALVREQVAAQQVAVPSRTIRLHTSANGGLIPVEADADRIGQVVANYLTNALKYSPPDLPVDVIEEVFMDESAEGSAQVQPTATEGSDRGWGGHGGYVQVAVRDQGPGLPEAEQARVWERFHRVPGVTAHSEAPGGSLGLGLHICKAIVEAHGGQVGVESTFGEGSTFWFTLPLSKPLVTSPLS